MTKVFISYHFDDENPLPERLIHRVGYHLNRQADMQAYAFADDRRNPSKWEQEVGKQVNACDAFVLFVGDQWGEVQEDECNAFKRNQKNHPVRDSTFVVSLPGAVEPPFDLFQFTGHDPYRIESVADEADPELFNERAARKCAHAIVEHFQGRRAWLREDGLPLGYPFAYEKDIIEDYVIGNGMLTSPRRIQEGCPQTWPECMRRQADQPLPDERLPELIGSCRRAEARILVDTRSLYHATGNDDPCDNGSRSCLMRLGLTLPEAGPRENLRYPIGTTLRVGIVVSGGIAPGINAVIEGVVKRHELYARAWEDMTGQQLDLEIRGFLNGLSGLLAGHFAVLRSDDRHVDLKKAADKGGSVIGTSRLDELIDLSTPKARQRSSALLDVLVNFLTAPATRLDILYIIGGDGSMRAAHAIHSRAEANRRDSEQGEITVVGIPKTMDNDILWVWQAFGFMSAVETARKLVYNLHTEASSNPRLGIIQLFGSDSGFVVSHAALASGVCDVALIPEVPFSLRTISDHVCELLRRRLSPNHGRRAYAIVLMAETAIPHDVEDYLDNPVAELSSQERAAVEKYLFDGRRVHGQTPDALRRAGLKIVSKVLEADIRQMKAADPFWRDFRVFTNEPRHVLRAIDPSTSDIVFGQRLGVLAVDNAMAGYTDFMISQWLTEYVLVPLPLVVLGRKRVPRDGIFWKSVQARTGQPREKLAEPPRPGPELPTAAGRDPASQGEVVPADDELRA